ncbi:J domain-containing protein [Asticcacaulis benevestitus]|uniref:J domain-containing protein n=1 Tax=Asticcacaulis benevestitus DSM 16100 = ATCC BAA-896 TaxID=1121022 RepID=V4Q2F4_9CAUL|nr:J domain-containing protein [Asticcacaulis benevestitus]ESQ93869.1 hypothetical protein ABENE_04065 [Asticcacaulis benevestitus DSM 16100 = ATCC BAA-896]
MAVTSIWKTLGIKKTSDRKDIRRAYAAKLKVTNPEDDAEGFKALREAYERALNYAERPVAAPALSQGKVYIVKASEVSAFIAGPELAEKIEAPAPVVFADPHADFYTARLRLEKILRATSAEPDMRIKALQTVLDSPSLEALDIRAETEIWMAQLLLKTSPYSDPLIDRIIKRFGWRLQSRGLKTAYLTRRILTRSDDLAYLERLKNPTSEHHDAYKVLNAPPKPPGLWRKLFGDSAGVRALLDHLNTRHDGLLKDMNADSLAHWEAYFEKPRLKSTARWALMLAPILLALEAVIYNAGPQWREVALLLLIPTALTLSTILHHFAVIMPRHSLKKSWRLQGNHLLQFGWGPAVLLLLLLAAVPASWPLIVIIGILATLIAIWVSITGVPDQRESSIPWQMRAFLSEGYLIAWWAVVAFTMPPLTAIQMSLAVIAVCFVSAFGKMALLPLWFRLSRAWRISALPAIGAFTVGAGALLWQARDLAILQPVAVSAITIVTLLQRTPALTLEGWSFRLRWITFMGMSFATLHGGIDYMFLFGGFALLIWTVVSLIELTINQFRSEA